MKMKIIGAIILSLLAVTQSRADLNGHFSSLYSAFGDHSTTDVTILSGPYDDPLGRGGTGDQWTATDGVYQFKISIEHSSEFNLSINTLIGRIEELPGPYIRALAEVSDPNEDGIAIYYDLGGAAAHGGKSYINMIPGAGSLIIAHEAGHTLEQVATQDDPTIPLQWQAAIASDNISVSGYGNGSWWEDVGEFSKIYALCLDGSQRPIVPMFGGLTPLEELHRLSPERFDLWESMLYPEPEPSNPRFQITAIDYSPADNMLTLTWDSIPGAVYAINYSSDLVSWEGKLDDAIDAASDAAETSSSFDLASLGLGNREKLFFRVEKQ